MSSTVPFPSDIVIIRDLRVQATAGPDRWGKIRHQPITLSLHVETPLADAGDSDDVADSVHYGDLAKLITNRIDDAEFDNLYQLGQTVADLVMARDQRINAVELTVDAGNQFLLATSLGLYIRKSRSDGAEIMTTHEKTFVRDLLLSSIIGVNPPERKSKQFVLVNLTFYNLDWSTVNWSRFHEHLVQEIESSSYLTLEAFVARIAYVSCSIHGADTVTIRAQKPSALTLAHSSGVEITRNKKFFLAKGLPLSPFVPVQDLSFPYPDRNPPHESDVLPQNI